MDMKRLRQNAIIQNRPFLTAVRWMSWSLHCLLKAPAIVKLGSIDREMYLLPRLKNFGSTSIFIKREHYEPELLAIRNFVDYGSVAVDIGGSFGIYTIFLSAFVGPAGSVLTFEPGDLSFSMLEKNVRLNSINNVSLKKIALSNVAGSASLYHIGNSPVNFSLGGAVDADSEMVSTERLDNICSVSDGQRISFVKIDVEGYEAIALEGAIDTIKLAKPVIMFEVSWSAVARAGLLPSSAYEILEKIGYQFYRYGDAGEFNPCLLAEEGNIFAVHTEHLSRYAHLLNISARSTGECSPALQNT